MHPVPALPANGPITADRSAIAAIFADPNDDPMFNKITRVAHEVLRQVPGSAAEPFMLISEATFGKRTLITCSCFYHTVVFLEKSALVLSREEGGMIPWVQVEKLCVPDISYLDTRVRLPEGVTGKLTSYFDDMVAAAATEQCESNSPAMSC